MAPDLIALKVPFRAPLLGDISVFSPIRHIRYLQTHFKGALFCVTDAVYVESEDVPLDPKKEYQFRGDASIMPVAASGILRYCSLISDGTALQRNFRQLFSIYVLAWTTCFFLPHWTTTPALFFFLNSMTTMAVEWSLRPVPALVRPWVFVFLSIIGHAVFTHARCSLALQAVAAIAILTSRYSIAVAGAVVVASIAVLPGAASMCDLKHPFVAK